MKTMLSFLNGGKPMQVGFVVPDARKAAQQYRDLFGISGWQIYTYGPPLLKTMTRRGKPCTYKTVIALNYVSQTRIELIEQIEGDTVYAEFISRHGYGMHHLGIYVPDIKTALAEAAASGFACTMEGGGFGPDGDGRFAYLDTEEKLGTTYELIERPARRYEPEEII